MEYRLSCLVTSDPIEEVDISVIHKYIMYMTTGNKLYVYILVIQNVKAWGIQDFAFILDPKWQWFISTMKNMLFVIFNTDDMFS